MSNSTLQSKIQNLASDFADAVLEIVRSSPLEDIVGTRAARVVTAAPPVGKKTKKDRLARRSDEDIAKVVANIVKLVSGKPKGLRAEQIKEELGLEAKELPRPLADALAAKLITKSGDKRATTYFAGAGKATAKSAKKSSKKTKPAKKAKAAAKKTKPAKAKASASKKKATTKKKVAKKVAPAKAAEAVTNGAG